MRAKPTAAETPPALEFRHIAKGFAGHAVLDGLDLAIPAGQIVALLGENGVGKTTLMRLASGYLAPDAGEIRLCGLPVGDAAAKRHLGYLPENAPPLPGHRVEEALHFFAALHGLSGKAAEEAVDRAVSLCELAPVRSRMAEQLSKGYRHRLGLAQALLHRPALLLLDEPTDGLDPTQKGATQALIRSLSGQCAILLSTHLLDEVPRLCDRVLILARHKIAYDGPVPADLPAFFKKTVGK